MSEIKNTVRAHHVHKRLRNFISLSDAERVLKLSGENCLRVWDIEDG